MLRLITFNVRSLRRPEALDLIINFMRTHGIHCAALQETWLPGSLVEQNKGFTIIRHNADGKAGERGGVAILLDPLATEAWGRAGNATELFSRRCIGVKLRFTTKGSTQNTVCFISAYAPTSGHTDAECDAFHDTMADAVAWAAPTDILALSGDFNASIGICNKVDVDHQPNAATPAVGPYGIRHLNAAGRKLRAFAQMHNLRASTTFFKSQKRRHKNSRRQRHDDSRYRTWVHPRSRKPFQLDHIFVNQPEARRVCAARVMRESSVRLGSDHRPVLVDIRLGKGSLCKPTKRPPQPQRSALQVPDKKAAFVAAVHAGASADDRSAGMLFTAFDDLARAMSAANDETLVAPARKAPTWMGRFKVQIIAASRTRDAAMTRAEKCLANSKRLRRARKKLSAARGKLRSLVKQARAAWVEEVVESRVRFVRSGGGPLGAAETWAGIGALRQGPTDTRAKVVTPLLKPDGSLTKNDEERCAVFNAEFEKQLNQAESFDPTALDEIKQFPILHEFDEPPTAKEVRNVFSRARNGKADGPNGIAAEHWKAVMADPALFDCVVQLVQILFEQRVVPEDWKLSNLKELPKKGDLRFSTNWRPIMLRDAAAKIVTLIFGLRIGKIYQQHGRESQCGFCAERGTVDGVFNVKSVVQLRREAGLPTWALWVDLKKAFDTVSRKAMVLVLAKYGVPPKLCAVFEALYAEAEVHLHVGEATSSFVSTMGVFQGCGSSPALFNFMVDAWFQAVEPKLREHVLTFRSSDATAVYGTSGNASNVRGRSIGDNSTGTAFEVLEGLYADDAGTLVGSRSSVQAVGGILLEQGLRWGMKMHTASTADIASGKGSKTEFTYFPVSESHCDAAALASGVDTSPIELMPGRWVTEATIEIDGKKILGFKYLGVVITPSLRDDVEVRRRITAASKAFGALQNIFKCASLSDRCKGTIFVAFVTSLLFYGCECWALRADLEREVNVFFNTCVRRICRIGKVRQWLRHIRMEHLFKRLGVRPCTSYLEERSLRWLGHVARMGHKRLPRLLLFGWAPRTDGKTRSVGAPQTTMAIRAHKLLLRVSKCAALPEALRAPIARTFEPPHHTRRQHEAGAAHAAGRNPYGGSRCAAQRDVRGAWRNASGTGERCDEERRFRFLTCENCSARPAHFGAYAPDAAGGVSFEPLCAAAVAKSRIGNTNGRCAKPRRPGFLTCGKHRTKPAVFDADGSNGASQERGWVDVAAGIADADDDARLVARANWKTVVAIFCDIPKTKKRDAVNGWSTQADDDAYGEWPKPSDEALRAEPDEMFTDGSSLNNGKADAAAGAGVFFDVDSPDNISQPLAETEPQTNNRGELTAILLGLRQRERAMRQGLRLQRIYTDSAYSIGCFGDAGRKCRHRGWKNSKKKEAANRDLLEMALAWRQEYGTLFQFTHVYAHTGAQDRLSIGNDHADHLAVAGAKQKGTVAPTLLVVAPGAPAGSELHEDAPTQAYDLFSQFAL